MPTGYTAGVADGKVTEFRDFALQCARGFGAFIHMRDDPMNEPLRKREASTYYEEHLPMAQAELKRLESLDKAGWRKECSAWFAQKETDWKKRVDENRELAARYDAMIAQAEAWEPPTVEHGEFKRFMLQQLRDSKKHDSWGTEPPVHPGLAKYIEDTLKHQRWLINHYEEEAQKERERVDKANRWAEQLFDSLGVKQPA